MGLRLELQALLEETAGAGVEVYFQPPANVQMVYPCIVYQRDNAQERFAGNLLYQYTKRYQVTFITRNPDSDIPDKIVALPMCSFNRFFVADNLHHDVFDIYF
jgi:hypothetical protein